jgi:hypothetical protein
MTKDNELEDSIPLENLPEWAAYEKHYEELEKAQLRIGKTPLKTMQWVARLLKLNVEKLGDLSKGEFENLAYEIAIFALLGTRRLPRIKAGKAILMYEIWGGPDWGDKKAVDESIPTREEVRKVLVEVRHIIDNIIARHQAEISLHETKLVIQVSEHRGDLFTFYGRIQDKFFFHLARLLCDFSPRLQRCAAADCSRLYISVRQLQEYCSTQCQRRIATRELRAKKRNQKANSAFSKKKRSINKGGITHGKARQ